MLSMALLKKPGQYDSHEKSANLAKAGSICAHLQLRTSRSIITIRWVLHIKERCHMQFWILEKFLVSVQLRILQCTFKIAKRVCYKVFGAFILFFCFSEFFFWSNYSYIHHFGYLALKLCISVAQNIVKHNRNHTGIHFIKKHAFSKWLKSKIHCSILFL